MNETNDPTPISFIAGTMSRSLAMNRLDTSKQALVLAHLVEGLSAEPTGEWIIAAEEPMGIGRM